MIDPNEDIVPMENPEQVLMEPETGVAINPTTDTPTPMNPAEQDALEFLDFESQPAAFTPEDDNTQVAALGNKLKNLIKPGAIKNLLSDSKIKMPVGKAAPDRPYQENYIDTLTIDQLQPIPQGDITEAVGTFSEERLNDIHHWDKVRSEISESEAEDMAAVYGYEPGQILNDTNYTRAVVLQHQAVERINASVEQLAWHDPTSGQFVLRPGVTDVELANFSLLLSKFRALDLAVRGSLTEAGRLLRISQMTTNSGMLDERMFSMEFDRRGGADEALAMIKSIAQTGGDPRKMRKTIDGGVGKNWSNALQEVYRNNLLLNVPTQGINLFNGLALTYGFEPMERTFGAVFGGMRRALTGDETGIRMKEPFLMYKGYITNFREGLRGSKYGFMYSEDVAKLDALKQDNPSMYRDIQNLKVDNSHDPAITSHKLLPKFLQDSWVAKSFDWMGKNYYRLSFRLLAGGDAFVKTTARGGEREAYAYRMGVEAAETARESTPGMTPSEYSTVAREAREAALDAPDNVIAQDTLAEKVTFTEQPRKGPVRSTAKAIRKFPGGWLFLPFERTPVNIVNRSIDYMPGVAHLKFAKEMLHGTPAQKDAAFGKMAMSTGLSYTVMDGMDNYEEVYDEQMGRNRMVHRPLFTGGGPANETLRQQWIADGWRPYSIWSGSEYIPYNRGLDPAGFVLGMVATTYEVAANLEDQEEISKLMSTTIVMVGAYFTDNTFFSGIRDLLLSAHYDQDVVKKLGPNILNNLNPTPIGGPGVSRKWAQDTDDFMRDTDRGTIWLETLAELKNRVPGWSETLPIKTDRWGRPYARGNPIFGSYTLSPVSGSEAMNDPVHRVLQDNNVVVRKLQKEVQMPVTINGKQTSRKIDLMKLDPTGQLWRGLADDIGIVRRQGYDEYLNSGRYDTDSPDPLAKGGRRWWLTDIKKRSKNAVLTTWLQIPANSDMLSAYVAEYYNEEIEPQLAPHQKGTTVKGLMEQTP